MVGRTLLLTLSCTAPVPPRAYLQESFEAVEKLVKLRGRFLAVSAGETDGDGMASSMVRSMMGQSFGDNLYGNRRGQRQLQFGGY